MVNWSSEKRKKTLHFDSCGTVRYAIVKRKGFLKCGPWADWYWDLFEIWHLELFGIPTYLLRSREMQKQ